MTEQFYIIFFIGKQFVYLFSSKPIVFDRPKIPMNAWHVPASSDHKVSISVVIMDTVLKSNTYSVKQALMITVHASVILVFLQ